MWNNIYVLSNLLETLQLRQTSGIWYHSYWDIRQVVPQFSF